MIVAGVTKGKIHWHRIKEEKNHQKKKDGDLKYVSRMKFLKVD